MTIEIRKDGTYKNAMTHTEVLRVLAQQRFHDLSDDVAALVDSSGGSGGVVKGINPFTAEAASGTNLADKTTSEAALTTVKNAIQELGEKMAATLTAMGLTTLTVNTGGAVVNGTIEAVTVAVTGAATGAQVTETNATLDIINASMQRLAKDANVIAHAAGVIPVELQNAKDVTHTSTLDALAVATGTAADPGITKVAMDAALVIMRDNIAAIAGTLIEANTTPTEPKIQAVM